ncbi:hypothetical protein PR001_g32840, partial [Phytophthora rubi]
VSGSVAEAGDGVRARGWQAAAAHQHAVSGSVAEAGDGVRARGWQAAAAHQQAVSGSVAEAGDGVRATNAELPSPSRWFMTPEVAGRRCRY